MKMTYCATYVLFVETGILSQWIYSYNSTNTCIPIY